MAKADILVVLNVIPLEPARLWCFGDVFERHSIPDAACWLYIELPRLCNNGCGSVASLLSIQPCYVATGKLCTSGINIRCQRAQNGIQVGVRLDVARDDTNRIEQLLRRQEAWLCV